MGAAEIAAARPYPPREAGDDPLQLARQRMAATGQWHPLQSMGRRWAIGCVALEITQRCNLDCTLCYLSDHSEAVKDIPLAEVLSRVDAIAAQYGPGTEVQVTGGDPTLRARDELVAIVRYVAEAGLYPNLFTNGIKATRDLLRDLARVGLRDVAFHIDTTQNRKGFADENALNALRAEYIARARGLGLRILFNTTVHDGNLAEIPDVARFMVAQAADVSLASFQLQAATGRGVAGGSEGLVNSTNVARQIQRGAGARISFDTPFAGHGDCNRHALTLVSRGRVVDLYDDKPVMAAIMAHTAEMKFERMPAWRAAAAIGWRLLTRPAFARAMLPWGLRKLAALRGRPHRLAFFIHDFMDAGALDRCRIEACVFMVQTADGPISMCLHNAKRDDFILQPLALPGQAGMWNPLTGQASTETRVTNPAITAKTAKGRVRVTHVRKASWKEQS